jgi:serine/threonine-protein kinase 24/25/MST4
MTLFSDILSIPSNPEDIFTLLNPIGHGAFGYVYKAIHNKSKKIYAIKIINYFKDNINYIENEKHINNINFCYQTVQQETSLMKKVSSSNYILEYYGSYFSRRTNTLWLIIEYCSFGSTIDLMLAMNRIYTEIEVATIIKMVLQGLIIIHEKNLIHRDIKGANILLSADGFAKLGDFGVGTKLEEDFRKSKKGSPYWMSPQLIQKENYDNKTDIWSLGITCIELSQGEPPNSQLSPQEVMEKIGNKKFTFNDFILKKKSYYSNEFINFVSQCLQINPQKRPSAKELIKHKFITKYAKNNLFLKKFLKTQEKNMENFRKEFEEIEFNLGNNNINYLLSINNKKALEKEVDLNDSFFNFSWIYNNNDSNNNKNFLFKKNSLLNKISPYKSKEKIIYSKISPVKSRKNHHKDEKNKNMNYSYKKNKRITNIINFDLNKAVVKNNSFIIYHNENNRMKKSRNLKNVGENIFYTKNTNNNDIKNKCQIINFGMSMKQSLNRKIYKKKIIINNGIQGKSYDKKYDKINSYKKIKTINSNINTDMNTTNTNSINNCNLNYNNSFILNSTYNSKKKINLKMKVPTTTKVNIKYIPNLNLDKILNNSTNKFNGFKESETKEDIKESKDSDYIINKINNYTINKGCSKEKENKNILNLINKNYNKNNIDSIHSYSILDSKDTVISIHNSNINLNHPHKNYY